VSSRDVYQLEDEFMSQLLIDGRWVGGVSTERLADKYKGTVFGEMAVGHGVSPI
jgi:hypothetical protein